MKLNIGILGDIHGSNYSETIETINGLLKFFEEHNEGVKVIFYPHSFLEKENLNKSQYEMWLKEMDLLTTHVDMVIIVPDSGNSKISDVLKMKIAYCERIGIPVVTFCDFRMFKNSEDQSSTICRLN